MPEAFAELERAIEVFARGFSFVRSFAHPYLASRVPVDVPLGGSLWMMRDAERLRGNYRVEEWITCNLDPQLAHDTILAGKRGRYAISAICPSGTADESLRSGFKGLGYRLGTTEPFMTHSLRHIPQATDPAVIERVRTAEMAQRLAKAARRLQIRPEDLHQDAPQRQYVALIDDLLVGWVGSIVVGDATWCQTMYVAPEFRRRGIARAMLCRMLRDDRAHGATEAVLLASHTGAKLYPVVGYRQIGTLLLFTPGKGATPS